MCSRILLPALIPAFPWREFPTSEFFRRVLVPLRNGSSFHSISLLRPAFTSLLLPVNEPDPHPRRQAYIQGEPSQHCSPEPDRAGVDSDPSRERVRSR